MELYTVLSILYTFLLLVSSVPFSINFIQGIPNTPCFQHMFSSFTKSQNHKIIQSPSISRMFLITHSIPYFIPKSCYSSADLMFADLYISLLISTINISWHDTCFHYLSLQKLFIFRFIPR